VRRLSSLAWRSIGARKLRSFLTMVGIALGVAVLFASLSAGAAMDAAVDRAAADEIGHADLRMQALEERGLGQATINAIMATAGVGVAAPALERQTYVAAGPNLTPTAALPPSVTVLGIDPVAEPRLHDMPLAAGRLLTTGDAQAALITETLAGQLHLAVGDSIRLNGSVASGPQAYEIVGLVIGDAPLPESDGRLVFMPLASAQALFGVTGVTRVDLASAPGVSVDELVGQLDVGIRTEPFLLDRAGDLADSLRAQTTDLRGALLLVAAVIIFAGAFLIFNTLSMTVSERTREIGLLRAAGTSRSQVMWLVLLQALAFGILGSALGVLAGVGVATIMVSWVRSAGPIALSAPALSGSTINLALAVGTFVTLAASVEPAWRAGRISPMDALRRGPVGAAAGTARLRWLVAVFAVLALAAVAIWPRSHSGGAAGQSLLDTVRNSGTWGPLVIYGLLLVVVLLLPRLLGGLVLLAGLPFRAFRNAERLARSSLSRDRSRTTLAAGALIVGVAMVIALVTSAQGLRSISSSWLTETLPGSELLTSIRPVDPADPVLAALAATPGVRSVSPIGIFGAPYVAESLVNGRPVATAVLQEGAAIVGRDYLASGRLNFVSGDPATALNALDSGGAVIVPSSFAGSANIRLGDTVSFATGTSPVKLRVVGIVAHSIPAGAQEAILVGWSDATSAFGVTGADFMAVRYLDGQEATARPVLDAAAVSYALQPMGLDRISTVVGDALDRAFRLLDALALIAILVAGLGVVNTLSMSVFERVREIGVLRATGMTSRQVWGMVVVEAGVLGIVGSLVGAVVGLLVGSLMVVWSSGGFGLVFDPPWLAIAALAGLGVLVSVAAAVYPASVASRISIIDAVQHE